ncbi:MAG TPA: hypothetical protein VKQ36_01815 [Ktedonobacterales bacterium]|nr:hypothetical protein [Ktedonobacterales bacterium]
MARLPLSLRMRMLLVGRPALANRIFGLMGARRLERAGRNAAIRAAQEAYAHVPFYHQLYEAHGFTQQRIERLTWDDFLRLPTVSKDETEDATEADLLDNRIPWPAGDALISRSSGTTREPTIWPVGWSEFYILRATFEGVLRALGAHKGIPTAVVQMTAIEGGDQSGNSPYRSLFSLKEETHWNFEVFGAGENPNTAISTLRWLVKQKYESLFIISFPGTIERLLDRLAEVTAADPDAGVNWAQFQHKIVMAGGQLVARSLRDRMQREMLLDPKALGSELIAYVSSDTGIVVARSTPFTVWLENYLAERPALWDTFGLSAEHRDKALLEFVPPMSVYAEVDPTDGLILTSWKHRPLIRYRINDLAWTKPLTELIRVLNKQAPTWRKDFLAAGGHKSDIVRVGTLGVVLGRADDTVIVNSANVSPAILQSALEAAGILPLLHYFKHSADPSHPNEYSVYLELQDTRDEATRVALAEEWRPKLLEALIAVPAASDLLAAHRTNPIMLRVFVRSRGEDEFAGDDKRHKKTHTLRPEQRLPVKEPAPVAAPSVPTA